MAESNQVIKFGNGIVEKAKSIEIDYKAFINLDTRNTTIRYKKMAPIVIASRLKVMAAGFEDEEEKKKLLGFIAELETAHLHCIDQGKCELIHWSSVQSKNMIHACLGVYNLYSLNGKPVCDFVLISTTQQQTIDKSTVASGWLAAATIVGIFIPVLGPIVAAGLIAGAVTTARSVIKGMTTKEQADILMLKTLEHYGLVRLLDSNEIQLINE